MSDLVGALDDPRIDERAHLVLVLLEDEDAAEGSDLVAREANAVRVLHQPFHAVDQPAEVVVEALDLARLHPQHGVAVLADLRERGEANRLFLRIALLLFLDDLADFFGHAGSLGRGTSLDEGAQLLRRPLQVVQVLEPPGRTGGRVVGGRRRGGSSRGRRCRRRRPRPRPRRRPRASSSCRPCRRCSRTSRRSGRRAGASPGCSRRSRSARDRLEAASAGCRSPRLRRTRRAASRDPR